MSASPTISAIIPVRDGAKFIAEALASICAQACPVSEIIVVDDGSADDTTGVVRRTNPEAIILRLPGKGVSAARNAGAAQARCDFLAYLDADDLWPETRTGDCRKALQTDERAGFVHGRVQIKGVAQFDIGPRLAALSGSHIPFLVGAGLVRRTTWLSLGGMDEALSFSEDIDFYLKLVEAGVRRCQIDTTTLFYRQHGRNRSRDAALSAEAMLGVMHRSARRRSISGAGRA